MTRLFMLLLALLLLPALVSSTIASWLDAQHPPRAPSHMPIPTPNVDVDIWAGLSTPAVVRVNPKYEAARVCLAKVVYGEARGEKWEGQVAVAQVVLRRAGLEWKHACTETNKPAQFAPRAGHGEAWSWALAAADAALDWAVRGGVDYSNRATFFHSGTAPYWAKGLEQVAAVGGHYFYR